MKKIIVTLVVLLLTAPTWADVTITATDEGGGVVAISYEVTGTLVRAFALDIKVDDGNIVDVNDDVNADYDIYPGSITIDSAGNITDAGSAVCSASYPGTLDGLDSNGVTIEAASLYEAGVDPAPPLTGLLLKLTVSATSCLTIEENTIRGGVVLEDVTSPTPLTLNGVCVSLGCWANPCQPYGDVNGDGLITGEDVGLLVAAWSVYDECADFNQDGLVTGEDIGILVNNWLTGCP